MSNQSSRMSRATQNVNLNIKNVQSYTDQPRNGIVSLWQPLKSLLYYRECPKISPSHGLVALSL
jgi:hypothetical protein